MYKGGARPLIGLFIWWGRGTQIHQLYEEREEKQRVRWRGWGGGVLAYVSSLIFRDN